MVSTTIVTTLDTHSVRLRINDPAATIDFGHNPAYPDIARVTEISVVYETRTKEGQSTGQTRVTSINYQVDHEEHQSAFVSPEFLEQPEEWPAWVRGLVDEHNPAG